MCHPIPYTKTTTTGRYIGKSNTELERFFPNYEARKLWRAVVLMRMDRRPIAEISKAFGMRDGTVAYKLELIGFHVATTPLFKPGQQPRLDRYILSEEGRQFLGIQQSELLAIGAFPVTTNSWASRMLETDGCLCDVHETACTCACE
ncbi:MAG: hypothetical protein R3D68_07100 [Hyphomicrobiaceae bacterium]